MSKENTRERKLQLIFGSHPKVDVFYVTSDDQAFYHENDADNHAKTLGNKSVLKAERRNYLPGKANGADGPEGGAANVPAKPKAPTKPKSAGKDKAPAKSKAPAKTVEPPAGDPPAEGAGDAGADDTGKTK